MASEYLRKKYKDVQPDPPPPPLKGKARLANWFYYYKWWLLAGIVLLLIVGSILWDALGIGKVKTDYVFAYVGSKQMSQEYAEALETALAAVAPDANGDGKVKVEMRRYTLNRGGEGEAAYFDYAASITLIADISAGESYFFLLEDPAGFQSSYQILARADGSAPDEEDMGVEDKVYLWKDCPALTKLDVEQGDLGGLYLGRRYFADEKQAAKQTANEELWRLLTEGATQSGQEAPE